MPRNGVFANFNFDPDVFSDYMEEQSPLKTAFIASGVVVEDPTISSLIGTKGNVGTMPFYLPMDAEVDAPLNYDGTTNNVPVEIKGNKQTFMAVGRMKAWTDKDFTRELTGANPLQHVGNNVANYYRQVNQGHLVNTLDAIMQLETMANHVTNLAAVGAEIAPENLITETTGIDAVIKACGDKYDTMSLMVMNSVILGSYKKKQLVEYVKYEDKNGIVPEVTLPTIDGRIVIVDDRGTVDTSGEVPVYKTYFLGKGAFLTAAKAVDNPYELKYDPEKAGGTNILYTKQSRVLHPNGFSFKADNVAAESPTDAEIKAKANWELKWNEKNVPIALVKSNG